MSYLNINMSHQNCKVGEMGARACGVRPIGAKQTAILRRPVTPVTALGVTPERAVWVEVFFRLLLKKRKKRIYEKNQNPLFQCLSKCQKTIT